MHKTIGILFAVLGTILVFLGIFLLHKTERPINFVTIAFGFMTFLNGLKIYFLRSGD